MKLILTSMEAPAVLVAEDGDAGRAAVMDIFEEIVVTITVRDTTGVAQVRTFDEHCMVDCFSVVVFSSCM